MVIDLNISMKIFTRNKVVNNTYNTKCKERENEGQKV